MRTAPAVIALLLLALASACGDPAEPPSVEEPPDTQLEPGPDDDEPDDDLAPEPLQLRVATFNVKLFFDTRCDSGRCRPGDWEQTPSIALFDRRADALADAIEALDADIVLLQELETVESLEALQQRMADRYPVAVLGETGGSASVDVGVLSTGTKRRVVTHRHRYFDRPGQTGRTRFAREFLEVQIDVEGHRVVVFSAHFKSKLNDDPSRRLGEATMARQIMLEAAEREPEATIILGGDLNDTPGSAPLNALEEGGALLRVASDVGRSQSWTYDYRGQLNELDHLYMVVGTGAYLPGTARSHHSNEDGGLADSDHAALTADFELR